MSRTLVIAPHPDDESLGCGGTLLRLGQDHELHWLIVTDSSSGGYPQDLVETRRGEIAAVSSRFGFKSRTQLPFAPARLDEVPLGELISRFGEVFRELKPERLLLPYRGDIHTDHRVVFDAAAACTKWFRYPSLRQVLCYEVLSETEFSLDPDLRGFKPTVFVDISAYLDAKIEVLNHYHSELGEFPFPRSEKAVRALAALRGASAGFEAAEAFMLLKASF